VANARLYELQAKIDARAAAFMAARVGETADVLFERIGRRAGQIVGRSPWLMPVHVDGPAGLIGSIARVRLTATHGNSLFGELVVPSLRAAPSERAEAAL
jgi:tRNA-2-methylthio-N6-dimethylallyladenosine synthase